MDVAIGMPNAVSGTSGEQLVEWARRAEARGFSSLGTIYRIAGRFTLGIGLGGRDDDYEASGVELSGRGA